MLLNLPFTKEKKTKVIPYYAVEISDEIVKVAVWQVDEGVISVIRTSEVIQVTGSKMDDYLQAVDMAMATATIDGEDEPKEVLYGLPPEWVDENGVVAARRSLLKYISERMQLKPIGFVMIVDALIEYLRIKQSTPPSAILIRFRKQMLDVCLVKLGKVSTIESVGRSNDVVADVKEGLVRIKSKDQFPPRIILFDGYIDFNDITQQLMAVGWEQELPFSHTPLIESLTRDMTVEAVAIAAGKEAVKQTNPDVPIATEQVQSQASIVETSISNEEPSTADKLPPGFSKGIGISTEPSESQQVVMDIDSADQASQDTSLSVVPSVAVPREEIEINSSDDTPIKTQLTPKKNIFNFDKLKQNFFAMQTSLTRSKSEVPSLGDTSENDDENFQATGRKIPIWAWFAGGALLLAGLGSAGVWAYQTQPKAEVIVGIKSQLVNQDVTFTVSQAVDGLDELNLILPAKEVLASASGSQTVPTTGTKRIGKTASGKVTIFNKTDKPKSFTKGTILVGPGNLRYELVSEVKVASKSAVSTGDGETVTFGKSDVEIAAGDIGEEYNQAAGKDFRFKDFGSDDFTAKNNEEISGGESSEKKAVSKDDRTNAKDMLTQSLETQATHKLNKELGGNLMVIDKTQETELEEITFDKKAGDEGEDLTAEGSIKMNALAVNKDDFNRILLKALATQIPSNYQVTAAGLQSQITGIQVIEEETNIKDKNKSKEDLKPRQIQVSVKAQVKIMPKLDFGQIKQALKGKTPQVADEYVRTLPSYNNHRISIQPNLPGLLGTMPGKPERIAVIVEEVQ